MPQPLEGPFSADESARLLRNYRYVVERTMRALGGWIALTPELSAKLLMGRHVWDLAQHCDVFGRRLPELRAPAQVSEAANPAVGVFMDAIEEPEGPQQTVERLVGVYRVLKPHLLATYHQHLARANAVYEPPTRRILARCIDDEVKHIAGADTILRHLAATPPAQERAAARQRQLETLLAAACGVTGDGLPSSAAVPTAAAPADVSDDAREFVRLETATTVWPIPEALDQALRSFAEALITGDDAALRRWCAPGFELPETASAFSKTARCTSHRTVAFARLGHQRLVKTRLDGDSSSAVVLTRWASSPAGWRVAALDVVGGDAVRLS